MNKITARFREASTYPSIASIIYGVGELFKIKEAPVVADTITQAGEGLLATGSPAVGISILLAGIIGFFMKEKK